MTNEITRVSRAYRGFEIRVERERLSLYWWVSRVEDGWEAERGSVETTTSVLGMVEILSRHVDDYYEHTEDYDRQRKGEKTVGDPGDEQKGQDELAQRRAAAVKASLESAKRVMGEEKGRPSYEEWYTDQHSNMVKRPIGTERPTISTYTLSENERERITVTMPSEVDEEGNTDFIAHARFVEPSGYTTPPDKIVGEEGARHEFEFSVKIHLANEERKYGADGEELGQRLTFSNKKANGEQYTDDLLIIEIDLNDVEDWSLPDNFYTIYFVPDKKKGKRGSNE